MALIAMGLIVAAFAAAWKADASMEFREEAERMLEEAEYLFYRE